MSARILQGLLSISSTIRASHSLGSRERFSPRYQSTALKIEEMASKKMINLLSFKEFKEKHVESWEVFKESPAAKAVLGTDVEKIAMAYERFCLSQYSQYKHKVYGGNPSLMT